MNPFTPADSAAVERGTVMFDTYCVPCHGTTGEGDGLVVQHGFPAPPSLVSGRAPTMSDAEIFNVITFGSGTMPCIRRADGARRSLEGDPAPSHAAERPATRCAGFDELRRGRQMKHELPIPVELAGTTRTVLMALAAIGVLTAAAGAFMSPDPHVGQLADGRVFHARDRTGGPVLRRHSLRHRLHLERRLPARA